MGKMILASSSPRRAEILKDYKLEIIPSPYVEQHTKTAFSYAYVEDLAYNKALAVVPLIEEEENKPQLDDIDTSKIGRNDPCPCGSGKKFKKCCGAV